MRGNCLITPYNFAVNDRPYDPTKKGKYIICADNTVLNTQANSVNPAYMGTLGVAPAVPTTTSYNKSMVWPANTHTAGGLPLFHETRVKGRAVYGLDTETLANDFSVLSGLNTVDYKPFNLVLEVDAQKNQFTRDSKINIFFYYDTVL